MTTPTEAEVKIVSLVAIGQQIAATSAKFSVLAAWYGDQLEQVLNYSNAAMIDPQEILIQKRFADSFGTFVDYLEMIKQISVDMNKEKAQ